MGRLRLVSVALFGAALSCAGGPPLPSPIPAPQDGSLPPREVVLKAARGQEYDVNPGASDRAVIDDEGSDVTIEPQLGAYRIDEADLAQGRVIGTFSNNSGHAIPSLGLAPHARAYWFVYRRGAEWYSWLVADGSDSKLDQPRVPTRFHRPTRAWRQSIAQWQLADVLDHPKGPGGGADILTTVTHPWVTCTVLGCCSIGG